MKEYQSLSRTRWDCKYHVEFIPKRRKKRVFGVLRRHLGDHVHICISIPPKYAVSNVGRIQHPESPRELRRLHQTSGSGRRSGSGRTLLHLRAVRAPLKAMQEPPTPSSPPTV